VWADNLWYFHKVLTSETLESFNMELCEIWHYIEPLDFCSHAMLFIRRHTMSDTDVGYPKSWVVPKFEVAAPIYSLVTGLYTDLLNCFICSSIPFSNLQLYFDLRFGCLLELKLTSVLKIEMKRVITIFAGGEMFSSYWLNCCLVFFLICCRR
jgi:hypothetical protein